MQKILNLSLFDLKRTSSLLNKSISIAEYSRIVLILYNMNIPRLNDKADHSVYVDKIEFPMLGLSGADGCTYFRKQIKKFI